MFKNFCKKREIKPLILLLLVLSTSYPQPPVCAEETEASYYTVASCRHEGMSGITASGERLYDNALTCAMRSRDFGKYYKITNIENGKFVIVRHNDFGPNKKLWLKGRKIDLSREAFSKIADLKQGIIKVTVERQ